MWDINNGSKRIIIKKKNSIVTGGGDGGGGGNGGGMRGFNEKIMTREVESSPCVPLGISFPPPAYLGKKKKLIIKQKNFHIYVIYV